MRTKRAAIAPCGRMNGGAPRTRTLDTIAGATVFKTASSASRTRSVCEMAPPLGIAPSSHRLTGGPHTLCVERNVVLPAGIAPASFRLEGGCLWSARPRERMKWSRASVLLRVSPRPKRGGLLSSSRAIRSYRSEMAACAGIAPATLTSSPPAHSPSRAALRAVCLAPPSALGSARQAAALRS